MHAIRYISTIFLLTAFSIPLLTPLLLQLKQVHVQWQMQEALEKQELLQVRIKTSDIKWIKNKKECVIAGEMFDVKYIQVMNDETVLTGLFDKKEKEIKRNLEDHAKNQQQSNNLQQLVKLFSVIISDADAGKIPAPVFAEINHATPFTNSIYISPYLGYTAPPPKIS